MGLMCAIQDAHGGVVTDCDSVAVFAITVTEGPHTGVHTYGVCRDDLERWGKTLAPEDAMEITGARAIPPPPEPVWVDPGVPEGWSRYTDLEGHVREITDENAWLGRWTTGSVHSDACRCPGSPNHDPDSWY